MSETVIARYRVGKLEIDPGQRCIRREGRAEHPRARVFDLLLYLLEHRDRPVTKQELVERVWGSVAVSDSVLYKTVLELRRVLGDDPDIPIYVKTLPKLGYQFVGLVEAEIPPQSDAAAKAPRMQPSRFVWAVVAVAAAGAAAVFALRQPGGIEPPREEIAWWQFDEGAGQLAHDRAGRNEGRLRASPSGGEPPHWAPGRAGQAVSLGGGNAVEGELRSAQWPAMTMMAWVQPHDTAAPESTVFDSARFRLTLTPKGVLMTRNESIGSVQPWSDGKWWHIAAVDEGTITGVGRIFVNGVELSSGALSPVKEEHPRWRIGQSFAGNAPFRGLVDDARVYGRPLRKLEIQAMYRCGKETPDLTAGGKRFYYLPVFATGAEIGEDGSIVNASKDLGGIQLGLQNDCSVERLRGADLGQDVRIALALELNRDAEGQVTEGGPYFRSRRAYPGDGIAGGVSGGYWLKLGSDGQMRVWQLRPYHAIATSATPAEFDTARPHRIEAVVRSKTLCVTLDGAAVRFEQDGREVGEVVIENTGPGMGTVGVAFSADRNRGTLGGQRVRDFTVESLRK